jgi:hypothetical protein
MNRPIFQNLRVCRDQIGSRFKASRDKRSSKWGYNTPIGDWESMPDAGNVSQIARSREKSSSRHRLYTRPRPAGDTSRSFPFSQRCAHLSDA